MNKKCKYNYNENYFEKIDTEEKAYWLGFIAADGSIINNGNALEISLSSKDHEHLIKFLKAIEGDSNMIKTRQSNDGTNTYHATSRIRVCCKKMCDDLAKFDIVPNKGDKLCFPTFLKKKLLRHYLRGYFDGDGSISTNGKNRNGSPKYAINIIATEEFLNGFMEFFIHKGISKVKLQSKNKMKTWNKVGINQITIVLDYLYKDSSVYLDRKYTKYINICSPTLNSH